MVAQHFSSFFSLVIVCVHLIGDDLFASIGIAANPKFDAPKASAGKRIDATTSSTALLNDEEPGGWGGDDLLDDLED